MNKRKTTALIASVSLLMAWILVSPAKTPKDHTMERLRAAAEENPDGLPALELSVELARRAGC